MTNKTKQRLTALTTLDELKEIEAVFGKKIEPRALSGANKAIPKGVVKLRRTFNMAGYRFWRVVGPIGHPNYMSDLSDLGLREWGII